MAIKKNNPSSYMNDEQLRLATEASVKEGRSLSSFIRMAVEEKTNKVLGVKK